MARGEAAPMLDGLVAAVAVQEPCQVALVEAGTMDRGKKWWIEGAAWKSESVGETVVVLVFVHTVL